MKFTLNFNMDNAVFDDWNRPEVKRILNRTAERVNDGETEGIVRDINGNTIGQFNIKGA